jgi:hypothetical protein
MGEINLEDIIFSDEVKSGWGESELWQKILKEESFINPQHV